MAPHLLLLSSGLSSERIRRLLGSLVRVRGYRKAQIIPSAHPKKERAPWAQRTREQLEGIGLEVRFTDLDAKREAIADDADLVYVCGGNTYHLLKSIQEHPSDIRAGLHEVFSRGGLYVGTSAGAVVAGPDVRCASVGGDANKARVTDFTAFQFIDRHIIPHYTPSLEEKIGQFARSCGVEQAAIQRLQDDEGLYGTGDAGYVLVGERHQIVEPSG